MYPINTVISCYEEDVSDVSIHSFPLQKEVGLDFSLYLWTVSLLLCCIMQILWRIAKRFTIYSERSAEAPEDTSLL